MEPRWKCHCRDLEKWLQIQGSRILLIVYSGTGRVTDLDIGSTGQESASSQDSVARAAEI